MIRVVALCALIAAPAVAQEAEETEAESSPAEREQRITASLVLAVANRDEAAVALIADARERGGYFSRHTADEVVLRVPNTDVDAVVEAAGELGLVVGRDYSSFDVGGELLDLRARLEAREEVLTQLIALVPASTSKTIVSVEREIVRLIAEIENTKGRIRYLEHQASLAEIRIAFQFRDRTAPTRGGSSSFAWLNTLNVADIVDDFRWDMSWDSKPNGFVGVAPDGFSAYKNKRQHRAVSPDEVLYRVRSERHKPQADLDFWKEAVGVRMDEAGYTAIETLDIEAGGATGFWMEFAAPLGTQDYVYAVAAFPIGGRLVVVEAAGEAARYDARRDAIRGAVGQLPL